LKTKFPPNFCKFCVFHFISDRPIQVIPVLDEIVSQTDPVFEQVVYGMVRARRRRTLKHREGEGEGAEHHAHHPPPAHLLAQVVYTVKKVIVFPVSSRDVTDQTLPGREYFNYSRPGQGDFG
jgi:hypothetical protein